MSVLKSCTTRLQKEYKSLIKNPVPCIEAHPSPNNLLEWHFVLHGKDEFEGGIYHGKITFPSGYPYKPPSILVYTPNGRFAPSTKICMSMTDFHPESWNPMWSVGTILTGLLSFMYDSASSTGTVITTPAEKQALAAQSMAFNVANPTFRKVFPHLVREYQQKGLHEPATREVARVRGEAAGEHAPSPGAGDEIQEPPAAPRPPTPNAGTGTLIYYTMAGIMVCGALLCASLVWSSPLEL